MYLLYFISILNGSTLLFPLFNQIWDNRNFTIVIFKGILLNPWKVYVCSENMVLVESQKMSMTYFVEATMERKKVWKCEISSNYHIFLLESWNMNNRLKLYFSEHIMWRSGGKMSVVVVFSACTSAHFDWIVLLTLCSYYY